MDDHNMTNLDIQHPRISGSVMAIALVRASEELERFTGYSALTHRVGFAVQAHAFMKNRTPEQVLEFIEQNYPPGI